MRGGVHMRDHDDRFGRDPGGPRDPHKDWPDHVDRRWRDDEPYARVRNDAQEAIRRAGSTRGRGKRRGLLKSVPKAALVIAAIVLGVALAVLATYLLTSRATGPKPAVTTQPSATSQTGTGATTPAQPNATNPSANPSSNND